MISNFLEACRFLTILPVPPGRKNGELAGAMFFFPLVGFLIGILSLLITDLFSLDRFVSLESLALVTFPLLLSGGLHLDGFADFADGFFGGKDRNDTLRIMRDPRAGVWGIAGIVFIAAWKWQLLASVPDRVEIFLFSLMASRWAQVALAFSLPYANPEGGLGEKVAGKVTKRALTGATVFAAAGFFFLKGEMVILVLALLPFLAGLGFLFKKRVGGMTGDLLGAASEMAEVYVLLIHFIIRAGTGP